MLGKSCPFTEAGTSPAIDVAIDRLLRAKEDAGLRPLYLRSLRQYLTQFARAHPGRLIGSITLDDIEEWFAHRRESAATRRSNAGRLSSLFGFAVRHGWLSANPCDRLEPIRIDPPPPTILTPDQAHLALRWTFQHQPRHLAFLVLTMLAGLRMAEAQRMTWQDIRDGQVWVSAAASKVRQRRIVDLHPTTAAWLGLAMDARSVLPVGAIGRRRFIRRLRTALGWQKWPQNVLRHTAATYLLAVLKNAPEVAMRLGNSPSVLLRHYRELVSAKEAEEFWNTSPAPDPGRC